MRQICGIRRIGGPGSASARGEKAHNDKTGEHQESFHVLTSWPDASKTRTEGGKRTLRPGRLILEFRGESRQLGKGARTLSVLKIMSYGCHGLCRPSRRAILKSQT